MKRPATVIMLSEGKDKLVPITKDYHIQDDNVNKRNLSDSVSTSILIRVANTIDSSKLGSAYDQDYPYRRDIHTRKPIEGWPHLVNNFVSQPAQIIPGKWRISFINVTEGPDKGFNPVFAYVFKTPTDNRTIAIDYFKTLENNGGERRYEGTAYFTSDTTEIQLLATIQRGYGELATLYDPNSEPNRSYVVPRALFAGEVPQKVIKTPSGSITAKSFIEGIEKYPLIVNI